MVGRRGQLAGFAVFAELPPMDQMAALCLWLDLKN
jgi:hypothetical protein